MVGGGQGAFASQEVCGYEVWLVLLDGGCEEVVDHGVGVGP